MEIRRLGTAGVKVSELCLGAMTFGREATVAESHAMLDMFKDAGGNFIDTADVYDRGTSEQVLGDWLQTQQRDDFIIATKVRFPMGERPNDVGLSRRHIMQAVDASLARLKTDYIDLYQIHCWDPHTPLEETLHALNLLVEQGKVRYIGASNLKAHQLQKAIDISRANNWVVFSTLQPLYNLLDRFIEWELVELCQREGLGIMPWAPLRGGWLTGRYKKTDTKAPDNTRVSTAEKEGWYETWSRYATTRTWKILDVLDSIAKRMDKTIAQVALNWVKDRPGVTAPITGARSTQQLKDNLGSIGWSLSDRDRQRLDSVSHVDPPYYPYGFIIENA